MFDTSPTSASAVQATPDMDAKYQAAMKSIRQKDTRRAASGHAVMAGVASYGEAVDRNGWLGKSARVSRHFLIVFACATPVYLFMSIVL